MRRRTGSIAGLPAKRPSCPACKRKLRPVYVSYRADGHVTYDMRDAVRHEFIRWEGYPIDDPMFDRTACAVRFAHAIVRGLRDGSLRLEGTP